MSTEETPKEDSAKEDSTKIEIILSDTADDAKDEEKTNTTNTRTGTIKSVDTTPGDSDEKILVPMECNQNIYNAFLIISYRQDFQIQNNQNILIQQFKCGLGIFSYIAAITQWTALILLMRVIMINSGVTFAEFDNEFGNDLHRVGETFFMWPFFIIGLFVMVKDLALGRNDEAILKEWNIRGIKAEDGTYHCKWKNIHVFFLKFFTETLLGYLGSLSYFMVIAIYSKHTGWGDILTTILNLLAYQFILDVDEWAYICLKANIITFIKRTSPDLNIDGFFKGNMRAKKEYSFSAANYGIYAAMFILVYSAILQSIFSRNINFCIIIVLCTGIPMGIWLFVQRSKYKKQQ